MFSSTSTAGARPPCDGAQQALRDDGLEARRQVAQQRGPHFDRVEATGCGSAPGSCCWRAAWPGTGGPTARRRSRRTWSRGRGSRRSGCSRAPGAARSSAPICSDCVSLPTSRWLTTDFLFVNRNSTGSSIVRMWPGQLLVAMVHHRGQRGALAGAGRADHQHQAALFHDQVGQDRRQRQRVERRDLVRDVAEHGGDRCRAGGSAEMRKLPTPRHARCPCSARRCRSSSSMLARRAALRPAAAAVRVGGSSWSLIGRQLAVDLDQGRRVGRQIHVRRASSRPSAGASVPCCHRRSVTCSSCRVPRNLTAAPSSRRLQSRSRSLMLVLARVCASTRLTITAQYRLYLPSALGRLPLTTTEPAGMRP